jgi:hypothetical protein
MWTIFASPEISGLDGGALDESVIEEDDRSSQDS